MVISGSVCSIDCSTITIVQLESETCTLKDEKCMNNSQLKQLGFLAILTSASDCSIVFFSMNLIIVWHDTGMKRKYATISFSYWDNSPILHMQYLYFHRTNECMILTELIVISMVMLVPGYIVPVFVTLTVISGASSTYCFTNIWDYIHDCCC